MYIQQIYTNCLAHAAYYIESGTEAAIVDPLRDTAPYLHLATQRGAVIKYVLETHFHADFVSGHLDLAARGAQVVFGPGATPDYRALIATDGQEFSLGNVKIKVLHTPGHTIESSCYLLLDENGRAHALFSGDTLFVGDVGRPDLLSGNLSKEELAAMLYDSLNNKIKPLNDNVIVYPGHGAGSACGKNIGTETFSTIGEQKQKNYAMLAHDKDDFIRRITSDLPTPPPYFFKDASINKQGYELFDEVIHRNLHPLTVEAFSACIKLEAQIIDTREAVMFGSGFIPGAINIGLNGDFAVWVGNIIDFNKPLLIVATPGQEKEAVTRLARIGYERIDGYLDGGIAAWTAAHNDIDTIPTYSHEAYEKLLEQGGHILLDVRKDGEVARERVRGSVHISLSELSNRLEALDKDRSYLIYCAGGYRSMIAASMLRAAGFRKLACIAGGINEVKHVAPHLVERMSVKSAV